MVYKVQQV